MNGIPTNEEEFRIWMVEKVGEIQTSCATIEGEVKTSNANHEALVARVSTIEDDNKTRDSRQWWHSIIVIFITTVKSILSHGKF